MDLTPTDHTQIRCGGDDLQTQLLRERREDRVARGDRGGTGVDEVAVLRHRLHPAAGTGGGFEHVHLPARLLEAVGGGQAGDPRPDDGCGGHDLRTPLPVDVSRWWTTARPPAHRRAGSEVSTCRSPPGTGSRARPGPDP